MLNQLKAICESPNESHSTGLGITDQEIGRIIAWKETRVAEIRMRYIDEAHIVASLVERLSKQA